MLTRREIVTTLLETLEEVYLGDRGEGITTRGDSRALELSPLYRQGSYADLEARLKLMHNQGHQKAYAGYSLHVLHYHVTHWYLRVEHVTRDVERQAKGKNGKRFKVVERMVVPVRYAHVRDKTERERVETAGQTRAQLAVDLLAGETKRDRDGKPCQCCSPQKPCSLAVFHLKDPVQLPKEILDVRAA